jgi:hypothetical protein
MNTIDLILVCFPNHPARMTYLRHTWDTLQKYLTASEHKINFICSSESERDPTRQWCGDDLEDFCYDNNMPLRWAQGPASLGHGMNAALRCATSNLIVLQQDDYELKEPLDLSPAAHLLLAHPEVDLVRYEYPMNLGCGFCGEIAGFRQFDLTKNWVYGDEPAMRRRDFMQKHGWYREDIGHCAEGDMLHRLVHNRAVIVAADKRYFGNFGAISAVPLCKETRQREVSR